MHLQAYLAAPALIGGALYLFAALVATMMVRGDLLQHSWLQHILFVENGPAAGDLVPFQTLPHFNDSDDRAFVASLLFAGGTLVVAIGVFLRLIDLTASLRSGPRIAGTLMAYLLAVHLADMFSGRAAWLQSSANAGIFVIAYVAAALFAAETVKSVTTSGYFRDNHIASTVDALFSLFVVFILSFRYEETILALMGSVGMVAFVAIWSYAYDLLHRADIAWSNVRQSCNSEIEGARSEYPRRPLAYSMFMLNAWAKEFPRQFANPSLYSEMDGAMASIRRGAKTNDEAAAFVSGVIGRFVYWLGMMWFLIIIPACILGYVWIFQARM